MFIRATTTRRTADGQKYTTYRLVHSEREGPRVRQRTLLNLGSECSVARQHWSLLCQRIVQRLRGQQGLLDAVDCPVEVARQAERLAERLLAQQPQTVVQTGAGPAQDGPPDLQTVDIDSLTLTRPRTVGVEAVGLWALQQTGVDALWQQLGLTGPQQAAATAQIIGRMAAPGSERATYAWLTRRSGLGELLATDFEIGTAMQLYRVSDTLLLHREAIERHLFARATELFDITPTITLYDLTNTYFEGQAQAIPQARHGRSKEKRSDCRLLTLALVLDASGFVRRSQVLPATSPRPRHCKPCWPTSMPRPARA
jgi:hypothetical protein